MMQNLDEKEMLLDYFELNVMQFGEKKQLLVFFKPNMIHFLDKRKPFFKYYEPSRVQNLNAKELLLDYFQLNMMMQFGESCSWTNSNPTRCGSWIRRSCSSTTKTLHSWFLKRRSCKF